MSDASQRPPFEPPVARLPAEHLEPALGVFEAAQALFAVDDPTEMLAVLARSLCELIDAKACMVSTIDMDAGSVRDLAGYARPPHSWDAQAEEYRLDDYPSTAKAIEQDVELVCRLDDPDTDPAEARRLEQLGYRSMLMFALAVEDAPYALIEIYDTRPRSFGGVEVRLCRALTAEAGKVVAQARMAERLEEAYFATLGALAAALEAKDAYTNDHAIEIAELAGAVCDELRIAPADSRLIRLGALLHDIGKIGIPESILRKPGPLTAAESTVMQRHPQIGARILEPVPHFAQLVPLVRASHERYDGDGYPDGLAADRIPLGSRVIGVCDAFHAMTEDRVYRKAMAPAEAIAEIERCSGTQFDPECVRALLDVVRSEDWPREGPERVVRQPDESG
ncbi:MAG TPA: HD domain-containing phosphohydrolase [Gaiellales bacterium]|jgi:putative nucleotidyltransferase with HDIG domain